MPAISNAKMLPLPFLLSSFISAYGTPSKIVPPKPWETCRKTSTTSVLVNSILTIRFIEITRGISVFYIRCVVCQCIKDRLLKLLRLKVPLCKIQHWLTKSIKKSRQEKLPAYFIDKFSCPLTNTKLTKLPIGTICL